MKTESEGRKKQALHSARAEAVGSNLAEGEQGDDAFASCGSGEEDSRKYSDACSLPPSSPRSPEEVCGVSVRRLGRRKTCELKGEDADERKAVVEETTDKGSAAYTAGRRPSWLSSSKVASRQGRDVGEKRNSEEADSATTPPGVQKSFTLAPPADPCSSVDVSVSSSPAEALSEGLAASPSSSGVAQTPSASRSSDSVRLPFLSSLRSKADSSQQANTPPGSATPGEEPAGTVVRRPRSRRGSGQSDAEKEKCPPHAGHHSSGPRANPVRSKSGDPSCSDVTDRRGTGCGKGTRSEDNNMEAVPVLEGTVSGRHKTLDCQQTSQSQGEQPVGRGRRGGAARRGKGEDGVSASFRGRGGGAVGRRERAEKNAEEKRDRRDKELCTYRSSPRARGRREWRRGGGNVQILKAFLPMVATPRDDRWDEAVESDGEIESLMGAAGAFFTGDLGGAVREADSGGQPGYTTEGDEAGQGEEDRATAEDSVSLAQYGTPRGSGFEEFKDADERLHESGREDTAKNKLASRADFQEDIPRGHTETRRTRSEKPGLSSADITEEKPPTEPVDKETKAILPMPEERKELSGSYRHVTHRRGRGRSAKDEGKGSNTPSARSSATPSAAADAIFPEDAKGSVAPHLHTGGDDDAVGGEEEVDSLPSKAPEDSEEQRPTSKATREEAPDRSNGGERANGNDEMTVGSQDRREDGETERRIAEDETGATPDETRKEKGQNLEILQAPLVCEKEHQEFEHTQVTGVEHADMQSKAEATSEDGTTTDVKAIRKQDQDELPNVNFSEETSSRERSTGEVKVGEEGNEVSGKGVQSEDVTNNRHGEDVADSKEELTGGSRPHERTEGEPVATLNASEKVSSSAPALGAGSSAELANGGQNGTSVSGDLQPPTLHVSLDKSPTPVSPDASAGSPSLANPRRLPGRPGRALGFLITTRSSRRIAAAQAAEESRSAGACETETTAARGWSSSATGRGPRKRLTVGRPPGRRGHAKSHQHLCRLVRQLGEGRSEGNLEDDGDKRTPTASSGTVPEELSAADSGERSSESGIQSLEEGRRIKLSRSPMEAETGTVVECGHVPPMGVKEEVAGASVEDGEAPGQLVSKRSEPDVPGSSGKAEDGARTAGVLSDPSRGVFEGPMSKEDGLVSKRPGAGSSGASFSEALTTRRSARQQQRQAAALLAASAAAAAEESSACTSSTADAKSPTRTRTEEKRSFHSAKVVEEKHVPGLFSKGRPHGGKPERATLKQEASDEANPVAVASSSPSHALSSCSDKIVAAKATQPVESSAASEDPATASPASTTAAEKSPDETRFSSHKSLHASRRGGRGGSRGTGGEVILCVGVGGITNSPYWCRPSTRSTAAAAAAAASAAALVKPPSCYLSSHTPPSTEVSLSEESSLLKPKTEETDDQSNAPTKDRDKRAPVDPGAKPLSRDRRVSAKDSLASETAKPVDSTSAGPPQDDLVERGYSRRGPKTGKEGTGASTAAVTSLESLPSSVPLRKPRAAAPSSRHPTASLGNSEEDLPAPPESPPSSEPSVAKDTDSPGASVGTEKSSLKTPTGFLRSTRSATEKAAKSSRLLDSATELSKASPGPEAPAQEVAGVHSQLKTERRTEEPHRGKAGLVSTRGSRSGTRLRTAAGLSTSTFAAGATAAAKAREEKETVSSRLLPSSAPFENGKVEEVELGILGFSSTSSSRDSSPGGVEGGRGGPGRVKPCDTASSEGKEDDETNESSPTSVRRSSFPAKKQPKRDSSYPQLLAGGEGGSAQVRGPESKDAPSDLLAGEEVDKEKEAAADFTSRGLESSAPALPKPAVEDDGGLQSSPVSVGAETPGATEAITGSLHGAPDTMLSASLKDDDVSGAISPQPVPEVAQGESAATGLTLSGDGAALEKEGLTTVKSEDKEDRKDGGSIVTRGGGLRRRAHEVTERTGTDDSATCMPTRQRSTRLSTRKKEEEDVVFRGRRGSPRSADEEGLETGADGEQTDLQDASSDGKKILKEAGEQRQSKPKDGGVHSGSSETSAFKAAIMKLVAANEADQEKYPQWYKGECPPFEPRHSCLCWWRFRLHAKYQPGRVVMDFNEEIRCGRMTEATKQALCVTCVQRAHGTHTADYLLSRANTDADGEPSEPPHIGDIVVVQNLEDLKFSVCNWKVTKPLPFPAGDQQARLERSSGSALGVLNSLTRAKKFLQIREKYRGLQFGSVESLEKQLLDILAREHLKPTLEIVAHLQQVDVGHVLQTYTSMPPGWDWVAYQQQQDRLLAQKKKGGTSTSWLSSCSARDDESAMSETSSSRSAAMQLHHPSPSFSSSSLLGSGDVRFSQGVSTPSKSRHSSVSGSSVTGGDNVAPAAPASSSGRRIVYADTPPHIVAARGGGLKRRPGGGLMMGPGGGLLAYLPYATDALDDDSLAMLADLPPGHPLLKMKAKEAEETSLHQLESPQVTGLLRGFSGQWVQLLSKLIMSRDQILTLLKPVPLDLLHNPTLLFSPLPALLPAAVALEVAVSSGSAVKAAHLLVANLFLHRVADNVAVRTLDPAQKQLKVQSAAELQARQRQRRKDDEGEDEERRVKATKKRKRDPTDPPRKRGRPSNQDKLLRKEKKEPLEKRDDFHFKGTSPGLAAKCMSSPSLSPAVTYEMGYSVTFSLGLVYGRLYPPWTPREDSPVKVGVLETSKWGTKHQEGGGAESQARSKTKEIHGNNSLKRAVESCMKVKSMFDRQLECAPWIGCTDLRAALVAAVKGQYDKTKQNKEVGEVVKEGISKHEGEQAAQTRDGGNRGDQVGSTVCEGGTEVDAERKPMAEEPIADLPDTQQTTDNTVLEKEESGEHASRMPSTDANREDEKNEKQTGSTVSLSIDESGSSVSDKRSSRRASGSPSQGAESGGGSGAIVSTVADHGGEKGKSESVPNTSLPSSEKDADRDSSETGNTLSNNTGSAPGDVGDVPAAPPQENHVAGSVVGDSLAPSVSSDENALTSHQVRSEKGPDPIAASGDDVRTGKDEVGEEHTREESSPEGTADQKEQVSEKEFEEEDEREREKKSEGGPSTDSPETSSTAASTEPAFTREISVSDTCQSEERDGLKKQKSATYEERPGESGGAVAFRNGEMKDAEDRNGDSFPRDDSGKESGGGNPSTNNDKSLEIPGTLPACSQMGDISAPIDNREESEDCVRSASGKTVTEPDRDKSETKQISIVCRARRPSLLNSAKHFPKKQLTLAACWGATQASRTNNQEPSLKGRTKSFSGCTRKELPPHSNEASEGDSVRKQETSGEESGTQVPSEPREQSVASPMEERKEKTDNTLTQREGADEKERVLPDSCLPSPASCETKGKRVTTSSMQDRSRIGMAEAVSSSADNTSAGRQDMRATAPSSDHNQPSQGPPALQGESGLEASLEEESDIVSRAEKLVQDEGETCAKAVKEIGPVDSLNVLSGERKDVDGAPGASEADMNSCCSSFCRPQEEDREERGGDCRKRNRPSVEEGKDEALPLKRLKADCLESATEASTEERTDSGEGKDDTTDRPERTRRLSMGERGSPGGAAPCKEKGDVHKATDVLTHNIEGSFSCNGEDDLLGRCGVMGGHTGEEEKASADCDGGRSEGEESFLSAAMRLTVSDMEERRDDEEDDEDSRERLEGEGDVAAGRPDCDALQSSQLRATSEEGAEGNRQQGEEETRNDNENAPLAVFVPTSPTGCPKESRIRKEEQGNEEEVKFVSYRLDLPAGTPTSRSKRRLGAESTGDVQKGDVSVLAEKSERAFPTLGSLRRKDMQLRVGYENSSPSPARQKLETPSEQGVREGSSPLRAGGSSGRRVSEPSPSLREQFNEERRKTEEEKRFPFCRPDIHKSINLNFLCMHTSCDDEDFLLRVALEKISSKAPPLQELERCFTTHGERFDLQWLDRRLANTCVLQEEVHPRMTRLLTAYRLRQRKEDALFLLKRGSEGREFEHHRNAMKTIQWKHAAFDLFQRSLRELLRFESMSKVSKKDTGEPSRTPSLCSPSKSNKRKGSRIGRGGMSPASVRVTRSLSGCAVTEGQQVASSGGLDSSAVGEARNVPNLAEWLETIPAVPQKRGGKDGEARRTDQAPAHHWQLEALQQRQDRAGDRSLPVECEALFRTLRGLARLKWKWSYIAMRKARRRKRQEVRGDKENSASDSAAVNGSCRRSSARMEARECDENERNAQQNVKESEGRTAGTGERREEDKSREKEQQTEGSKSAEGYGMIKIGDEEHEEKQDDFEDKEEAIKQQLAMWAREEEAELLQWREVLVELVNMRPGTPKDPHYARIGAFLADGDVTC